jgi:hypothetical protein
MNKLQDFLNFVANSRSIEDIHDATQEYADVEGIRLHQFSYEWDSDDLEDFQDDDLEVDLDWQPLD